MTKGLAVRHVALIIKTPDGANPPSEWDWAKMLDVDPEHVTFVAETYIGEE